MHVRRLRHPQRSAPAAGPASPRPRRRQDAGRRELRGHHGGLAAAGTSGRRRRSRRRARPPGWGTSTWSNRSPRGTSPCADALVRRRTRRCGPSPASPSPTPVPAQRHRSRASSSSSRRGTPVIARRRPGEARSRPAVTAVAGGTTQPASPDASAEYGGVRFVNTCGPSADAGLSSWQPRWSARPPRRRRSSGRCVGGACYRSTHAGRLRRPRRRRRSRRGVAVVDAEHVADRDRLLGPDLDASSVTVQRSSRPARTPPLSRT